MCLACGNPSADHASSTRPPIGQFPRRHFLGLLGAGLAAAAVPSLRAAPPAAPAKPQNVLTPDQALERLIAGNRRYVNGTMNEHDFAAEREALAGGQNPFAAILSCADSRIGPEFAFDASRGDLFVVRVAGNFLSNEGLASLEYTTAVLGTPLIVVLGHEACGAIDAAIKVVTEGAKLPGHLPGLVRHLKPAVKAVTTFEPINPREPGELLAQVTEENVTLNVERLKSAGPVIEPLVETGKVKVVGAVYRLATGQVDFFV